MKLSDRAWRTLVFSNSVTLVFMLLGCVLLAVQYRDLLKSKFHALIETEKASSKFLAIVGLDSEGSTDSLNSDCPEYGIKIKSSDLRRIQVQLQQVIQKGILTDEMKTWYPASFYHQGEEYSVKIRIRGDLKNHWENSKKSWRIRFQKGKLFQGRRFLDLIVPRDKSYEVEHVSYDVCRELGLLVPDSGYARVRINGVDFGVYTWMEKYGPEMLEKLGYPIGEIFREPNVWTQTRSNGFGITDYSDYTGSIEAVIHDDPSVGHYVARWDQLLELVRKADDESLKRRIVQLVDMEKFLTWNAITWMFGNAHSHASDNLRWYYDNTTGLFEPILYDVSRNAILISGRGLGQRALWSFEEYEISLLCRRIIKIPEFRQRRNEILWRLINDARFDLAHRCREYAEKNRAIMLTGVGGENLDLLKSYENETQLMLSNNRADLKEHLSHSRVFVTPALELHGSTPTLHLGLLPDSRSFIKLKDLKLHLRDSVTPEIIRAGLNLVLIDSDGKEVPLGSVKVSVEDAKTLIVEPADVLISTPVNERLRPIGGEWTLSIEMPGLDRTLWKQPGFLTGIEMSFSSTVTRESLADNFVFIASPHYRFESYLSPKSPPKLEEFVARSGLPFETKGDRLVLPRGEYLIKESLTIPDGYGLELSAGCVLKMEGNVSFVCYGPLTVSGTPNDVVRIIRAGEEAWGAFAVVRAGKLSRIKHLNVSGGSEAYINGLYLSGQLCFYHSDLELENCVIQDAQADDGLNVKKSQMHVRNCMFAGNASDGFDADWTTGVVHGCVFINNRGDGLDFSGSRVTVQDCLFRGCGDKGLSAGERSQILALNNVLQDSEIGIASKDFSDVRIFSSVFFRNKIGVAIYRKKQLFGGGQGMAVGTLFWENEKNIEIDAESSFKLASSAAESWQEGDRERGRHLLNGRIEKYYSNDDRGGVVHAAVGGASPFLISVSTELSTMNGVSVPQLSGLPAGLSRPFVLEPSLLEDLNRFLDDNH